LIAADTRLVNKVMSFPTLRWWSTMS
jgi:hypothetical protein